MGRNVIRAVREAPEQAAMTSDRPERRQPQHAQREQRRGGAPLLPQQDRQRDGCKHQSDRVKSVAQRIPARLKVG
jgi:hypothetical protein